MKLALMALAIEISLVRMFAGSWVWAMGIVFLYCALVYIVRGPKILLPKKRTKNKFWIKSEYTEYKTV